MHTEIVVVQHFLQRTTNVHGIFADTATGDFTLIELDGQHTEPEEMAAAHPEVWQRGLRYVGLVGLEGRLSECHTLRGTLVIDDRRTSVCAFQPLPVELAENVRIEFEGFHSAPWWLRFPAEPHIPHPGT